MPFTQPPQPPSSRVFTRWLLLQCAQDGELAAPVAAVAARAARSESAEPTLVAAVLARSEVVAVDARAIFVTHLGRAHLPSLAAWLLRPQAHKPTALARIRDDVRLAEAAAGQPHAREEHLRAALGAVPATDLVPADLAGHVGALLAGVAIHPAAPVALRIEALLRLDQLSAALATAPFSVVATDYRRAVRGVGVVERSALAVAMVDGGAVVDVASGKLTDEAVEAIARRWLLPALDAIVAGEQNSEGLAADQLLAAVADRLGERTRAEVVAAALNPRLPLALVLGLARALDVAESVDWGAWPVAAVLAFAGDGPVASWVTRALTSTAPVVDLSLVVRLGETFTGTFTELLDVVADVGRDTRPAAQDPAA